MTNHVHLQLVTEETEIWTIMKNILSKYSNYFNHKYDLVGHVFQGRYHSEIIKDAIYFAQTSRYIHLNPVKAGIVKHPILYPWSSYGVLLGSRLSKLIDGKKIIKEYLGTDKDLYKVYVENKVNSLNEDKYKNFEEELE